MSHNTACRRVFRFCSLIGFALFAHVVYSWPLSAQQSPGTGEIHGVVTDNLGVPTSGATVTAKDVQTGVSTWADTDQSGKYDISGLRGSIYEVGALTGPYGHGAFSQSKRKKVRLSAGESLTLDFQLNLGVIIEGVDNKKALINATKTGIDVLEEEHFAPLRGKRVGLITNQTGVDMAGRRTIDVLAHAPGVKLVALFSPEHGISGSADAAIANATDPATGLPIYSLYGETRRPTDDMLRGIDTLVFDIQDVGVRFYTYITTMAYSMEEAAKHHIPFFVLDRPDPLGGEVIEGPMLDTDRISFVGYFPMPVRYAMTMGELARMFNAENKIGADLQVIAMKNWGRRETYDETGLAWIPPSPNLRTLGAAFLYPGVEILQAAGVSVGRGTDAPFAIFGAPWIDGGFLATELNPRGVPGVIFASADFTPADGLYKGQLCHGVRIEIADHTALRSMRMGLEIADALKFHPEHFDPANMIALLGSESTVEQLERRTPPAQIVASWAPALAKFRKMRSKYLLYL
ncbi:MAG: exo-beta-N-acetylmuramidase NamZ domain-containing protein [Candidatus Acidiferrales bacterium]